MIVLLFSLLTVQPQDTSEVLVASGARDLSVSGAGRVAFALNGDIWVTPLGEQPEDPSLNSASLVQVTSGPTWDCEPAWTADGTGLVFSSDRNGGFDLWRIDIGGRGPVGEPRAVTAFPGSEREPVVAADGSIVFVRGRGPDADLWLLPPQASAEQLTDAAGGEISPTISPDGTRVAYVSTADGSRELRVRHLKDGGDRAVLTDRGVEYPTWSPNGDVVAFSTRSGDTGVWVTPIDGRYVNLVSERRAEATWTPGGEVLLLAELPAPDLGYNGDPDRVGDRDAGDAFVREGRIWSLRLGVLPDQHLEQVAFEAVVDRETHNAAAFDRAWERTDRLYFRTGDTHVAWSGLRNEYRDRAISAATDEELGRVVDEMLRERPRSGSEVSGRAAVSSAHPLATEAGVEMLRRGGNVVDAAVAVSFAIGVVEPDASGIGGYGEMVLYLDGMEEPTVIEFLTRVPEHGGLDNAALFHEGRLPPDGPVLTNVPGTVAGMWRAWKEYGSGNLAWSDLLQPAIVLAERGFPVSDGVATTLDLERERYLQYESSAALFFPAGEPLRTGDTLRNPDLGWTLRQIANGGADAFYRGEVARRVVEDLRGKGNAITLRDMDRYYAGERAAVRGEYHGHTIYSAAPASSGGASLVAKLTLLDNFESARQYLDDVPTAHAMIEAWKLAPSMRIADPGLWPVDLGPATDRDAARARWRRCFDPTRTLTRERLAAVQDGEPACMDEQIGLSWGEAIPDCLPGEETCRANGTTAFAVADTDGNIVSVTQTLGTWGGNFYVSPGLGFIHNDKLRSYSTDPNSYGARLPYARHGTSIAPTLVFRGTGGEQRPLLAVGAAGNAWITSAVYQMVVAMIDGGMGPQAALEAPRFLIGRRRGGESQEVTVQIEDAFGPGVLRDLERLGHNLQRISLRGELRMGYGAAVMIGDGGVRAGGDPRRSGAAGAVTDRKVVGR